MKNKHRSQTNQSENDQKHQNPADYNKFCRNTRFTPINDTPVEIFKQFRIIVIEFHHLEIFFSKEGFKNISSVFEKILSNFKVVHIHPNNCKKPFTYKDVKIPPVMEFTFLRNDRIKKLNQENGELDKLSFPHTLDEPNVPNRVDYALPKCWYSI